MTKDTIPCSGCRDDYYNRGDEKQCWLLAKARRVQRTKVGTWQPPPYKWQPQETYHCNHPQGSSWIEQDDPRIE